MARPRRTDLDVLELAAQLWDQDRPRTTGFLARTFTQTSLPYRDPGPVPAWGRRNGDLSLVVQPGMKVGTDGGTYSIGLPFGTTPRLLLTWMCSEAVKTKSPELHLGTSLSEFMRGLGLAVTGGKTGTIRRLREQMERLFSASMIVTWDGKESRTATTRTGGARISVATAYDLWWADRNPDAPALLPSRVMLTPEFFNEVVECPVPLDMAALRVLRGSPLRLDMYAWLTYRMSYLRHPTTVPWKALRAQFGSGLADTPQGRAQFRRDFEKHLAQVLLVYGANVEATPDGIVLRPSSTSVPMRGRHTPIREVGGAGTPVPPSPAGKSAKRATTRPAMRQLRGGDAQPPPELAGGRGEQRLLTA